MKQFFVLTLFPEMIEQTLSHSIMGRAQKEGHISVEAVNIRDFTLNKHKHVDDYPYGGGAGLVMQGQPIYDAYQSGACARGFHDTAGQTLYAACGRGAGAGGKFGFSLRTL